MVDVFHLQFSVIELLHQLQSGRRLFISITLCYPEHTMKAKTYRDPSEVAYGDFDNLAAFLRTDVFAEEDLAHRWRAIAREYASSNPGHVAAVVDDLNQLLADPRATDEQVTR